VGYGIIIVIMAITFQTTDSAALLHKFKKAIDEKRVLTWTYDKDGDFTHNTDQWRNWAWLRPKHTTTGLTMIILCPQNRPISTETYAIYHGRFIESMLAHCDTSFTNAIATAVPSSGDVIQPKA
jgi:hypothetical protein